MPKIQCLVCKIYFDFPEMPKGLSQPRTCKEFTCAHKFAHHPENYLTMTELLDKARKAVNI